MVLAIIFNIMRIVTENVDLYLHLDSELDMVLSKIYTSENKNVENQLRSFHQK